MNDLRLRLLSSLVMAFALAGCASLEPPLPEARPDIPQAWRTAEAAAGGNVYEPAAAADIPWQDFFADPSLKTLIGRALENNRDLRAAALAVERARAQYRVQRADRLPTVAAGASLTRAGGDRPLAVPVDAVQIGISAFELDFFGRVRNLSDAALQRYLATEEARRAAHIALVAEVANAYLTLAADRDLLEIARNTLKNHESVFDLTVQRQKLGAASALETQQARTAVESARSDVARFGGQIERDLHALGLLVGAPVEEVLLPKAFAPQQGGLPALPLGVPSEVLLRRPDILQAEHQLRAANADIGAARAAFFPSISLTTALGTSSTELTGLFGSNAFGWSFVPRLNLPIFDAGRLQANLEQSDAQRGIALAQYEKAIQAGFTEVADGLSLSAALAGQREAQTALVAAAQRGLELSEARYKAGIDSFLTLLDAQRTLYAARQGLVSTQAAEQTNRVNLYRALGGGWRDARPRP